MEYYRKLQQEVIAMSGAWEFNDIVSYYIPVYKRLEKYKNIDSEVSERIQIDHVLKAHLLFSEDINRIKLFDNLLDDIAFSGLSEGNLKLLHKIFFASAIRANKNKEQFAILSCYLATLVFNDSDVMALLKM